MRPERMIRTCLERGINALAITDHNRFDGALELQDLAPFTIIPGEEIKTSEGELIGYFLTDHIERGLSPEETARRIREQGGVVNVPHPFDGLRGSRLNTEALERLVDLDLVDMIEIFNARMTRAADNDAAESYALKHSLPGTAGSDAHTYAEIGAAYMDIRPFDGPGGFIEAVREGRMCGRLSPWPVHFASTWAKVAKRLASG